MKQEELVHNHLDRLKIENHCNCKKPNPSGEWEVTSAGSYAWCQTCGKKYQTKVKYL